MSKAKTTQWVELESPWSWQPGLVRIAKTSEDLTHDDLLRSASRNELRQPYIFETELERRLHFTHDATQSAMKIDDPDALVAHYTRKMMACLLFNPNPKHIVMIGMGGGSLPKFCYRHLSHTRITVVEVSADAIAMRDEFLIPKDDQRFRVVHDDGARFIESLTDDVDILLVDAFDADGIALSLANSTFYSRAAAQLSKEGILVMNFWGVPERYVDNLALARAAFGERVLLVPVAGESNLLMFAFKKPVPQTITERLEFIARRLQFDLLLDFPRYLSRICQGHSLVGG